MIKKSITSQMVIILSSAAVILLAVLIFCLFNYNGSGPKSPKVENGVIDLTGWDFEKDGIICLDGEWEFYWNRLLNYEDLHGGTKNIQPDACVPVPDIWNNYRIGRNKLPGEGYGTYRLKIRCNDVSTVKGIKISNLSTAYKLMVDGETVAENGVVGKTPDEAVPEYRPQTATFRNYDGEFEIIVQISNYTYARGGLWYSIYLGTDQQINTMKENASRREMFIFGGIFMMIVYQLFTYLFLRRNVSILYYILMMLVIAIRIPVTGEYFICDIFPGISIGLLVMIEYLTICWAPVTWILFLRRFYPNEISRWDVRAAVCVGLLFSAFTVSMPIHIYTKYLLLYEFMVIGMFIYAFVRFAAAVSRKREGVAPMLFATAAFFAAFINDALYQWNLISSRSGGVFGISAFIIIFIQAYILAAQFSKTYSEVEELSDKLLSLDKLKDEFLANTSHELRTPLNGIINLTQSVVDLAGDRLEQPQQQDLKLVISAGRHLSNLINDIMDMSSLRRGEIKLDLKPVDARTVAAVILHVMEHTQRENAITLINSIPEDLPPAEADENRIRQVYYNLIGNALKFTENGRIETGGRQNGNMLELWVEDTGCGIPEGKQQDIFNAFYQLNQGEDKKIQGTGLGLSIIRQLIALHGGSITVQSSIDKGARFTFTLPISSMPKAVEPAEIQKAEEYDLLGLHVYPSAVGRRTEGKYSILVAEDDAISLRALLAILNSEDCYIKAVQDGQQALDEINQQPNYDLMILDIMMPKVTGFQVLKSIRERFSGIELPVLLLTAKARQEDIKAGFDAGANDYIAKPFEAEELKARVATLIQMKKSINSLVSSELSFLQAQIKPHFLFNALGVISSLSTRDPKRAKQLLLNLSDYLRGSFNFENHNGLISLSTEILTVEAYLAIEKERFKERLQMVYDIDEGIAVSIPILSIQPLVENAVRYGIRGKVEGGTVKVTVKREQDEILIAVEDDGQGIEEDKLRGLLEPDAKQGVGLKNIHKRMLALYGKGLNIESKPGQGTKVTMRIPVISERGGIL